MKDIGETPNSFYSYRQFSDAPNPMITIDEFGPLGIPLSVPEAQRLIASSRQAPFGMAERTLVDTSVRDTWEIDASNVRVPCPLQSQSKHANFYVHLDQV